MAEDELAKLNAAYSKYAKNEYVTPEEVLCGIEGMEYNNYSNKEIIAEISKQVINTAKKIITEYELAPDFDIDIGFYYVSDESLSEEENRKSREEYEESEWYKTATWLTHHPVANVACAAETIIEAAKLETFLYTGEIEKAVISMAKLLSGGLLHSDANTNYVAKKVTERYRANTPDIIRGRAVRNGHKHRKDQHRKEHFQEWAEANYDKFSEVKQKNDLKKIPELERFFINQLDDTVFDWFKKSFPAHEFKGGAPKKNIDSEKHEHEFKQWVKNNPDKLKNVTYRLHLKEIKELQPYFMEHYDKNVFDWFEYAMPNKLLKKGKPPNYPLTP